MYERRKAIIERWAREAGHEGPIEHPMYTRCIEKGQRIISEVEANPYWSLDSRVDKIFTGVLVVGGAVAAGSLVPDLETIKHTFQFAPLAYWSVDADVYHTSQNILQSIAPYVRPVVRIAATVIGMVGLGKAVKNAAELRDICLHYVSAKMEAEGNPVNYHLPPRRKRFGTFKAAEDQTEL